MAYNRRNMFENTKRETKEIGYGKFNYLVIIGVGLQRFSCLASVLIMSFVVSSIGCDFRLTPAQKGTLTSILFVGMVSSSHLNGFLSDRYGRRYTTLRCSALCCIISCAASFAFNYTMLVILWFFMGFFLAGVITPVLVYVSEFSPPKHRRKTIFMSVALAALATTYDPCVAWLIIPLEIRWTLWPGMVFTSWRLLLLWNSVPFLAAWLLLLALPESPKYLLTRGKDQETIQALARAFAMNTGQDKADYPIKEVGLDGGDSLADDDGGSVAGFFVSMWRQTRMLFTPPLLLHTLLCCSIQVGVVGTYNSVMLWFPDTVNQMSAYAGNHPAYGVTLCQVLAHGSEPIIEGGEQPVFWNNATRETFLMANGSRYAYNTEDSSETEACVAQVDAVTFVSNITVGILQLTAFLATNPVVALFGRKIVLGCLLLIPGVCCFLIANVADIMYLSIALMTSLAVLISSTVPIILSIIVDLFPTNIRSMATSVAMICGRLGAAAGGQIFGIYQQTHCTAAFNTVGVVLICIAGVVVSTVPNERKPA